MTVSFPQKAVASLRERRQEFDEVKEQFAKIVQECDHFGIDPPKTSKIGKWSIWCLPWSSVCQPPPLSFKPLIGVSKITLHLKPQLSYRFKLDTSGWVPIVDIYCGECQPQREFLATTKKKTSPLTSDSQSGASTPSLISF